MKKITYICDSGCGYEAVRYVTSGAAQEEGILFHMGTGIEFCLSCRNLAYELVMTKVAVDKKGV